MINHVDVKWLPNSWKSTSLYAVLQSEEIKQKSYYIEN